VPDRKCRAAADVSWRLDEADGDHSADGGFTHPLLLKVSQRYCDAPWRIMVVGQQTDTWYNDRNARTHADPVGMLMDTYAESDLARPFKKRSSPYWWASHHIASTLNGNLEWDFVWTDLVRIDQHRARPHQQLEAQFCAMNLLARERELLVPDVVIFFTGPSYEQRLLIIATG
jgi:hypothetical protein